MPLFQNRPALNSNCHALDLQMSCPYFSIATLSMLVPCLIFQTPCPYFLNATPIYFRGHGIEKIRACIQKIRQRSKVKLWLLCALPVQDMPIMKHFWMPVAEGCNRLGQTLKAGHPYQQVTLGAKIVMKPFDDPLLLLVNKHEFISHVYQLCSSTMFISFVHQPIYQQKPNLFHPNLWLKHS